MNIPNCPQCGTQINNDLPGGLCPSCLMAVARQSQPNPGPTQAMPHAIPTPAMEEIANLFPELEILDLVGRGGMGAVYKVRQKNLDRIVALKVFLYRSDDPEFAARFQREARALAKLRHPNIVSVHDIGKREFLHYLIMEFVDGVNLRELTHEERLKPEVALQMVPQLCDALQYAHDQGVIHRDIKPENLLLDVNGNIRIADFGLAKMTGNVNNGTLTHTQQVMGTLNYMAPEQRERPTEVDHRADIYSLGVVIYELLTGELPIGRFQPPSSKSSVKTELDEVVMRALEKEPERRYQQISDFGSGFQNFEATGQEASAAYAPAVSQAGMVGGNQTAQYAGFRQPLPPVKNNYEEPRGTRCMITLMSGREKKGNWRPGDKQLVFTMMGGTCLDLTEVQEKHVDLTLFTLMGGTEVIVPRGSTVDLDGFIVMGATEDDSRGPRDPNGMRVRIRSWGAMGGTEVRNSTISETRVAAVLGSKAEDFEPGIVRESLVMIYKTICMLLTIAIPIVFVAGHFRLIDNRESQMFGILTAIVAGLFWSQLNYFRRLIGAGPENDDRASMQSYYGVTWVGAMIRSLGTMVGFAVPILFVIDHFEHEPELKFAAIVCGIVSVSIFVFAGKLDEMLFGRKKI